MLLVSIKLTLMTLLRRQVLHYSWGDHQTLSLPVTLLLTVATLIYSNH